MIAHSSNGGCTSSRFASRAARFLCACARTALPITLLAACGEHGILEPDSPRGASAIAGSAVRAGVVVTPNYSAFDARTDFNNAGVIAHLNGFDEFSGRVSYMQSTPWTTNGVTYTSGVNIVLGPGIGFGVQSNAVSGEFGQPIMGSFAAGDAFTLFGVELTLIGTHVPVSVVVFTNLGSYAFDNLDVPLAAAGNRLFGVGFTRPGEHLTGFRFSYPGASSGLLLDNVAVGHVGDANAEPVAVAGGPYAGNEGSAIALDLGGSDGDGDQLSYSWDLGDGTTGSGPTPPSSHVYVENGSYDITLTASDGRGGTNTAHATATVANVAPALAPFALPTAPVALIPGGVTVNVATTFVDPGALDTHTASVDCGSGLSVQSAAPNGAAAGSCTFEAPGVYLVQLTVRDDDGGSDTRAAAGQVVVYDVAAGWVTGGGWITSGAGSYVADPTVTGKLTFGLVARYQSSASAPDGNADFKLHLAKLDFRSTALDWLVVTDGTARLRGRGTLNGTGDFEFAVTVIDKAPDSIRIHIWDRLTGEVVYDNRAGEDIDSEAATPIGGGSIQVRVR